MAAAISSLDPDAATAAPQYKVTKKKFKFAADHGLPFYFVSASDGTNVVGLLEERTNN